MIRVQEDDFNVADEIKAMTAGKTDIGGVCSFIGLVRGDAGNLDAMTLEHYPAMTEKELARIDAEAHERWPLDDSLIIHRHGRLVPGDQIVLVLTASRHRAAAFEACAFLIDWLKTQAPFWKSEETRDGETWVAAKSSDDAAAERWEK